jgi:hypothetical protein
MVWYDYFYYTTPAIYRTIELAPGLLGPQRSGGRRNDEGLLGYNPIGMGRKNMVVTW